MENYNNAREIIKEYCQNEACQEDDCTTCPYPLSVIRCGEEYEYTQKEDTTPVVDINIPGQIDITEYIEIPKKPTVYLAGKMTGLTNYKALFDIYSRALSNSGYAVFNPATLPTGLDYEAYFPICFMMIDTAKHVALMPNWKDSPGATREKEYAESKGYKVTYLKGGVS